MNKSLVRTCCLMLVCSCSCCWAQDDNPSADVAAQQLASEIDIQLWWQAAQAGNEAEIKRLLQLGLSVDMQTDYGATALMFAAGRGHVATVETLLEAGADPNVKDRFYGSSPMRWAAMKNNVQVATLLVQAGSRDVNTAMLMAVRANDAEVLEQLIELIQPTEEALSKLKSDLPQNATGALTAIFADVPDPPKSPNTTESKSWQPTPRQLELYAGRYVRKTDTKQADSPDTSTGTPAADAGQLSVTVLEDRLVLETDHPVTLQPLAPHEFQFGEATIKFGIREQRVVDLVIIAEKQSEYRPISPPRLRAAAADASREADLAASSANWMQFRGQGARGVAEGQAPPVHWNVPKNENVLWKRHVPGLAHSCPIVVGDKLFVTTAVSQGEDAGLRSGLYGDVDSVEDENQHSFELYCLDKQTGEMLWKRVAYQGVPQVKRHLKSTHANPTPVSDGQYVIAFFGSEGLYCYDLEGELQWERNFGTLDSGWFFDSSYQWGFAASPIIYDDTVIVQCDIQENSFVAALRLSDGEVLWRTARDEIPSWSTPTVVSTTAGPQLVTTASNFARAYDPSTGQELWRIGKLSEIVVPTPFYAHGLIFIASGYRPIKPIYAILPTARGDLTEAAQQGNSADVAWSSKQGGPYMVTPVCYGNYFYTCNSRGVFECLDARTGEQVYRKRISTSDASSFVGSLVAGDGHVYVPSEEGVVLVVKAGSEFEIVAENPLGELLLSTPVVSEGVMFLRGQSQLVAIQENGRPTPGD